MEDISLYVLDLVQNSIAANADLIIIEVIEDRQNRLMTVKIEDNGRGIHEHMVRYVTDPFFTTRTTRKVGLGLPMAKIAAESSGGSFSIQSDVGQGTRLTLNFDTGNIDCPPFGNMGKTLAALVAVNPHIDFIYTHTTDNGNFSLDTREVKHVLNGLPINNFEVVDWICSHVYKGINEVNGGKFGEISEGIGRNKEQDA